MANVEPDADGTEECITIQPAGQNGSAGVMPYPYHVIVNGAWIARQDHWRGNPYKLIGFATNTRTRTVSLLFSDWVTDPGRAVGKYPVFESAGGKSSTLTARIESIRPGRARR